MRKKWSHLRSVLVENLIQVANANKIRIIGLDMQNINFPVIYLYPEVEEPILSSNSRSGISVVEWGGCEIK